MVTTSTGTASTAPRRRSRTAAASGRRTPMSAQLSDPGTDDQQPHRPDVREQGDEQGQGGRGRRRRVEAEGRQRRQHHDDPEQRERDRRGERQDRGRPAIREVRPMAALHGLRTRRGDQPEAEDDEAREEQPACGAAPRGHERHEEDGEAHDGADPADEVERGDAAALEAEHRRRRIGAVRGNRHRGVGHRPGQGSGYEPGALEGFWGAGLERPRRVVARVASAQRRGRRARSRRVERLRHLGGDRIVGREVGPLEVLAAPGAQRPVEPDEAAAVRAHAVEPGPAGGADDPLVVDAPRAGRAGLDRLDLGEEGLLREVPLVDLADLLLRAHDAVDDHARQEQDRGEQDDERGGEVRQDRVLAAQLHVPEGPVRGGEPQDDDVDRDGLDRELHDRVREEPADRVTDRSENLVHAAEVWPPRGRGAPRGTRRTAV